MAFTKTYMINNEEVRIQCDLKTHNLLEKDQALLASSSCSKKGEVVEDSLSDNGLDKEFKWTRETTKLLIESYAEIKEKFRDPKIKKKDLWMAIVNKFRNKNYKGLTTEALDRKWRNLKKRYSTIKDTTRKTGRGRISWEYYTDFDDIYREDCTINFPPTISSINHVPQNTVEPLDGNCLVASTSQVVSPVAENPKEKKKKNMRGLYGLRKRLIEVEESRVNEIKKLRMSIERSNDIQQERNNILKSLAEKL